MKKLLALLMAVAVTFQLVTPVFADTEGTEETTTPTEAVVETEAPTEAPAEETTAPTEETTAPTEETSAPTEETEEATEATEETVEDIALFADNGDVIASGECGKNGDNLTWVLTGDGTLTISGSGEMENYTDSSVAPWYSNRTKILSAVVEPGVESVGNYAFYSCLKLASVSLPGGVKSIGESAFQDCAKLTAVEIPEGVTSIGSSAFSGCSGLTSVTIPDGVTSIGGNAFWYCSSLSSVTIPESVTSIGSAAFQACSRLKHVYYGGSDLQWKEIEIGKYNSELTKATIHYASTHAHNVEHVPGKAASCTETGNLEYWLCSICGKYFTDEGFTQSTDEAGVVVPALGHAMTRKEAVKPTAQAAGNIEYYICSRCGKLFKDALGEEETTLEKVTLPAIPYVSEIDLARDGELLPDAMEVECGAGDTMTLVAMVWPVGAETTVRWSSSTPAVARVDQDGVVTLLTSGTTVIKAAATDGSKNSQCRLHKGKHLPQEVIHPQNLRRGPACQPIRLHAELLRQIFCPAEMKITRDDQHAVGPHAVRLRKRLGKFQILARVARLLFEQNPAFVHTARGEILCHDGCLRIRFVRALPAGDDDARLRMPG